MDPTARAVKKRREAERLRDVPPEETVRMGFQLMELGRRLREAADRARA